MSDLIVTDQYVSKHNGVTHVYLRQRHRGIEVYNANFTVNVGRDGKVISAAGYFVRDLAAKVDALAPDLDAASAVTQAATDLGLGAAGPIRVVEASAGSEQKGVLEASTIAREEIPAKLVLQALPDGQVRLGWNLGIYEKDASDWWDVVVDAQTGDLLHRGNWIVHDDWGHASGEGVAHQEAAAKTATGATNYNVWGWPAESPIHGARGLVSDPFDALASPLGWHNDGATAYTITRGNNVYAYEDRNADNLPGHSPDGDSTNSGTLTFDFPVDLTTQHPHDYQDAVITNLFYWNNLIHDITYRYGFDEVSGNFQALNGSGHGVGGDYVFAEAMDGSGVNNANFATPPDGQNPRMQMYVWSAATPHRSSDLDAGIIVHEYAHGISNRLTGGPNSVGCLSNFEQMGEGWSDFYGLMYTMGQNPSQIRGVGNYSDNLPTDGPGIRRYRYSPDMAVNPFTYADVADLTNSRPHGIGSIWATMLWDLTWALIDEYGYDPDVSQGTGGNNLALQLVTDGLKMQPCQPGFVDGRDAILAADRALTGGENERLIWEVFARRGLGYSAHQGTSLDREDGVAGFDMPPHLTDAPFLTKTADRATVEDGGEVTYTLHIENRTPADLPAVVVPDQLPEGTVFVAASHGGTESSGGVTFPEMTIPIGATLTRNVTMRVETDGGSVNLFTEDHEGGAAGWTAGNDGGDYAWVLGTNNPYSGAHAWHAPNVEEPSDLWLTSPALDVVGATPYLRIWHAFETEGGWDGGVIDYSTDGGATWHDLGPLMVDGRYTGQMLPNSSAALAGRRAFIGSSPGYIQTVADLSSLKGTSVQVRFRFASDDYSGSGGWYVDDVALYDDVSFTNVACAVTHEGKESCDRENTMVLPADVAALDFSVESVDFGSVMVGRSATMSFTVVNKGASTLDVTSVATSDAAFTVVAPNNGVFSLERGETAQIDVTFAPAAVGQLDGTLTLESNDATTPTASIPLSGVGVEAPIVGVDPTAISVAIPAGGPVTRDLVISNENTEPSELDYRLSFATTQVPFSAAAKAMADRFAGLDPAKLAAAANAGNVTAHDRNTPLYLLPQGSGTVVLSEDFNEATLPSDWQVVDHAGNGVVWATSDEWGMDNLTGGDGQAATANSDKVKYSAYDTELISPEITVPEGTGRAFLSFKANYQYIGAGDALDIDVSVDGTNWVTAAHWRENHGVLNAPVGEMAVIDLTPALHPELGGTGVLPSAIQNRTFHVRWRYYNPTEDAWDWYIQIDDVEVIADPHEWVMVDQATGTIPADSSVVLGVIFNASGLRAGHYEGTLMVMTNDPVTPQVDVAVEMDVTDAPNITASPGMLDFDRFPFGGSAVLHLNLINTGTEPLEITGATAPAGFGIAFTAATLAPGASTTYAVTFAPDAAGTYDDHLVFTSNDPDAGSYMVPVHGVASPLPKITVDPFELTIPVYETTSNSRTLTIQNTGMPNSELNFWAYIDDSQLPSELISHSASQTLAPSSVRCPAGANSYIRHFDPADFGIEGDWNVDEVQFGVAGNSSTTATIFVGLYLSQDGDVTVDFDDLITYVVTSVAPANAGSIVSVPINAVIPEGYSFTAEIYTGQPNFLMGNNAAGQSAPSYIVGPNCGIGVPTTMAAIGFPNTHWVINVHGQQTVFQMDVTSGDVAEGASETITVRADGRGLENGSYSANLIIGSNDPEVPTRTVPVHLIVSTYTVSTPEATVHPNQVFEVPVEIQSTEDLSLETYEFTLTFDPAMVQPLSVLTQGTLSEGYTMESNLDIEGEVTVAGVSPTNTANIIEGQGGGTLVKVMFQAKPALGDATFTMDAFMFDEGALPISPEVGAVTLAPMYGDANLNLRVTAFDAGQVLKHVARLVTLDPVAETSSDVSGNSRVTAFDAGQILKHVAHLVPCFPVEEGCEAASKSATEARGVLAWGEPTQAQGRISVPIEIGQVSGEVTAVEIATAIDPALASLEAVTSRLPEGWQLEHSIEADGRVQLAMAGSTPLSGGVLAELVFQLKATSAQLALDGVSFVNESAEQVLSTLTVKELPTSFSLDENHPNPFNPATMITYQLAEPTEVRLDVFNMLGQRVQTLVNTRQDAGRYTVTWDALSDRGAPVSSGTYIYRITAGSFVDQKVMVLLK